MLSKRMEAVVNMVSPQSFDIADIGCDHAYISIALVERNIAKKVVAMDVKPGPLEIAKRNINAAGFMDCIDLRLSNGLEKLRAGEVDTIIMAGMGGMLIKSILEKGESILNFEEKRPVLILQPQSDLKEVRIFLHMHAYHIVQEKMLIDEGKYYTVMKAEPGTENQILNFFADQKGMQYWNVSTSAGRIKQYTQADWEYGKYNLEHGDRILFEYLIREHKNLMNIHEKISHSCCEGNVMSAKTKKRANDIYQAMARNKMTLKKYYDYEVI